MNIDYLLHCVIIYIVLIYVSAHALYSIKTFLTHLDPDKTLATFGGQRFTSPFLEWKWTNFGSIFR